MNADLLAMLGGAGMGGGSSGRRSDEGTPLISFKAGKMTTEMQTNGKYMVSADPRRGQISLNYHTSSTSGSAGTLKFEWKDRRTRTTVDDLTIVQDGNITFTKVDTGRENDRVYLLQYGPDNPDRRYFYWMQDKLAEHDDENQTTVNTYLTNLVAAATAAGDDDYVSSARAARESTTDTAAPSEPAAAPSTASQQQQVDALSNILESLGMPQGSNGGGTASSQSASSADAAAPAAAAGGTLTLADLQGAMAGLATSSPPPPPLTEILSPDSVEESGILNDESTVSRLLELLPEGQRNKESLIQNLRSPQCMESIKTLQSALGGSDAAENLYSILANFELDTEGLSGSGGTNPVEVFLDAVVKSVEKEGGEESKEEEGKEKDKSDDKEDKMEE